jgi:putative CocE/NonD family hydrolase
MSDMGYDVVLERNVPSRMRDGVTLYADVYRPKGEGPFPVVLMRLPYDKAGALTPGDYAHPSWYARHGFIVVIQDTRGRWRSEGDWSPFFNETSDGYDTVQWSAALPGSNGRVGMYGASYVGATQHLAAIAAPPGLGCVCPAVTSSSYYEGWTYEGGAFHLAFVENWSIFLATDTARRAGRPDLEQALTAHEAHSADWYLHLPLKSFPPLRESQLAPYFFDWLDHPTYDEYWKAVSPEQHWNQVRVPGLHIGAWYDIFLDGTLKNFGGISANGGSELAQAGQRLLIGPWYHWPWQPQVGEVNFGPQAASRIVDETQVRFYNWRLRGEDDGISMEPPVKIFVMGENVWRDEHEWPLERTVPTPYYFHSDGFANSLTGDGTLSAELPQHEPYDTYVYDPRAPSVSRGGHSCCFESLTPQGAYDQRPVEQWKDVLCFTSEPVTATLEVTGPVSVNLWAATSAVDTDWIARLVDVYPDGRAINLTAGILRARYRESLEFPKLIERDTVYEYHINLRATSNAFLPGHRLRVDIQSSSYPHWDRNPNTGQAFGESTISDVETATQTVFHDAARPSHVTLPVVPR